MHQYSVRCALFGPVLYYGPTILVGIASFYDHTENYADWGQLFTLHIVVLVITIHFEG